MVQCAGGIRVVLVLMLVLVSAPMGVLVLVFLLVLMPVLPLVLVLVLMLMRVLVPDVVQVLAYRRGGISPWENFGGKFSPLRKVANFSPGEILAAQCHSSPQLQDCVFFAHERA